MIVQVRIKSVYGKDTVYPANDIAQTFAEIAGTTTLTPATLALIRRLGITIEVQQSDPAILDFPGCRPIRGAGPVITAVE